MSSTDKVIVTDVADGCAASGLVMKGDKVLAINGTPVTDEIQGRVLAKAAVGEVVFSVLRGDARVTVTANKPEATTRLGVTMKNPVPAGHPQAQPPKPLVIYAEPVAAYDYAPEYDDYEPPTRTNRYEQNSEWPGLFDCCSAGNSLCLYAYCCMPCLAGQMYSNVFKREPGCCTKLSGMRAFVYAFLGFIMIVGTERTELGVNLRTFLSSAPFLIPLPGMIFSVIMVYTLFKASRATPPCARLNHVELFCCTGPPAARAHPPVRHTARLATAHAGSSGAAQPFAWPAERRLFRRLPRLVLLLDLRHRPASALPRL